MMYPDSRIRYLRRIVVDKKSNAVFEKTTVFPRKDLKIVFFLNYCRVVDRWAWKLVITTEINPLKIWMGVPRRASRLVDLWFVFHNWKTTTIKTKIQKASNTGLFWWVSDRFPIHNIIENDSTNGFRNFTATIPCLSNGSRNCHRTDCFLLCWFAFAVYQQSLFGRWIRFNSQRANGMSRLQEDFGRIPPRSFLRWNKEDRFR